jgi:competence protein ComEC
VRTVLEAVDRHPRHVLLFALTAGLLTGPLSPSAPVAAAVLAATLTAVARASAASPLPLVAAARVFAASPLPLVAAARVFAASPLPLIAAAAVLAGATVADARLDALEGGPLPRMHGRSLSARAELLEPVRERAIGPAVARARLLGGPAAGEVVVLRVRSTTGSSPGAWPDVGEIVAARGTVAPLGLFDAYQRRRGASAALEVAALRRTGERRGGFAGVVDAVRRRAEAGLVRGLRDDEAALLRGMVLGQDERLADDVRDDFKRSGLAHVLAVSGQNVMLLTTLVLAAGALVGLPLRTRLVAALALVALYVPLTGAGPSIQRAGVMGAAGLVAALAGRPAHRWYALGLAAAITLALNPLAVGEPGWQLSFAAVVALLALVPSLRAALARHLPGPVADVAAITVAATIGTAPLMALHFEQVSLAALPANLLAAAAIAPVMWLGMLSAAAAQIAPELALPFNAVNAPLLAFVEWVARTFAAAPAAVVPVRLGSPAALAAAYGALAVAVLGVRAAWRRAGFVPGAGAPPMSSGAGAAALVPIHRGRRAAGALALVALTGLGCAKALDDGSPPPAPGELVVSFLDVGQGDATLLQMDGAAVLVDTGPPGGPILRRLDEAGVERLDALVITHAQSDHEGAALEVLGRVPTRLVVNGGAGWPSRVQDGLPRATRARRIAAHAGQVLTLGGIRMRLLWPPPPGPGFRAEGDPNVRAVVALVQVGSFDVLLPADAESDVTAALDLPRVEALKVAHHGSADEGLPALLERTDPQFAAIEVGERNTYGHPAPSTLAALRAVDHVYRTDRDGTVRLRVRDGVVRVDD